MNPPLPPNTAAQNGRGLPYSPTLSRTSTNNSLLETVNSEESYLIVSMVISPPTSMPLFLMAIPEVAVGRSLMALML